MATRTDAYPDVAIPPGEYIGEEIEARASRRRSWPGAYDGQVNAINEIINGKEGHYRRDCIAA